jgi:hypothetical protein
VFLFDGHAEGITCNKFQALFISRKVEQLLLTDDTIDRFAVDIDINDEIFAYLESLIRSDSVDLNEENWRQIATIAQAIDNDELLQRCVDFGMGPGQLTSANCADRLRIKERFDFPIIEDEILFAASNFYEINLDHLRDLKPQTIERIVSHPKLILGKEETLLELIISLAQTWKREEFAFLYGYVECRYLTLEGVQRFVGVVDEDTVDHRTWASLCRRLLCNVTGETMLVPRFSLARNYNYVKDHEFEGMIHEMTGRCGGNVHWKKLIEITTSSRGGGGYESVVNHKWDAHWFSDNVPGQWI